MCQLRALPEHTTSVTRWTPSQKTAPPPAGGANSVSTATPSTPGKRVEQEIKPDLTHANLEPSHADPPHQDRAVSGSRRVCVVPGRNLLLRRGRLRLCLTPGRRSVPARRSASDRRSAQGFRVWLESDAPNERPPMRRPLDSLEMTLVLLPDALNRVGMELRILLAYLPRFLEPR
jgi:hypothetical protein